MAKRQTAPVLKPALIIGSGFHRHVLGSEKSILRRKPLWSWDALIDATARRMSVERPARGQPPVLRWEAIVLSASSNGFHNSNGKWIAAGEKAAHRAERDLRQMAANILAEAGEEYPRTDRSKLPMNSRWGTVISLNFDFFWYAALAPKKSAVLQQARMPAGDLLPTTRENARLFGSLPPIRGLAPRVWFPNGSLDDHASMRMGIHDYGDAPHSIRGAFAKLKKWERLMLDGKPAKDRGSFAKLAQALKTASENPEGGRRSKPLSIPLTWVTEFMYRPLVFVGVGLSQQEAGLWWLLAQRARNQVRLGKASSSSTKVLVGKNDRRRFWEARPFGIEPVICENWEKGWKQILS